MAWVALGSSVFRPSWPGFMRRQQWFPGTRSGRARPGSPFLQADGGDIELLTVSGNSADVRLTGMCRLPERPYDAARRGRICDPRGNSGVRDAASRVGAVMLSQQISMDSVVVGRSARMRAVFGFLRVIGNSDSTVLVTGERHRQRKSRRP